jgi:hypothetical protein
MLSPAPGLAGFRRRFSIVADDVLSAGLEFYSPLRVVGAYVSAARLVYGSYFWFFVLYARHGPWEPLLASLDSPDRR